MKKVGGFLKRPAQIAEEERRRKRLERKKFKVIDRMAKTEIERGIYYMGAASCYFSVKQQMRGASGISERLGPVDHFMGSLRMWVNDSDIFKKKELSSEGWPLFPGPGKDKP